MSVGATNRVPETVPPAGKAPSGEVTITVTDGEPATTAEVLVTVRTLPNTVALNPPSGVAVNGPGAPEIVVVPLEPTAHAIAKRDEGLKLIDAPGVPPAQVFVTATWNDIWLKPFET